MASKRDKCSASSPSSNDDGGEKAVRLLLHTVDGAIPYLTPHLLETCFPIEQVKDFLWIGIAVRDACISPFMAAPKKDTDETKNKKKKKSKPSGYAFSATTEPDAWLLPYTRVTVPTFDPCQDSIRHSHKNVVDVTASNDHIMVWTEFGRQKLTREAYDTAATNGLQSHASVTLFDVCTEDAKAKRKRASLERTNAWREETIKSHASDGTLWASCLVAAAKEDQDPGVTQQFESIQNALDNKSVNGVAFVNWQTISDASQRVSLLQQSIQRIKNAPATTTLAVLSTNSLEQVMECFQQGINIIGTNLPIQWAKQKKAFVCDVGNWKNRNHPKRPKLEPSSVDEDGCFLVDSERWIRDANPILAGCSCLTCQQHCRAYLYHLVKTKELLAEILLFIHNLHHMIGLFRACSQSRISGSEQELCRHIQDQIANNNNNNEPAAD
ncbi:ribosyltransferase accessory subunit 2 [Seminavis robusta]|uniref:Ribosyltransferase accessory subunit 2 n=1 Tax=Seminavis robusta TaxID=568900 RepID=A0A9N8F492_9STRA|nr:ribosyltransferase accessory subunit 2 [Seminavis robusta]|eukprot:Sro3620_g349770.1 ribosyltransferase accessory subunit 2 (440) ;mRNA; r:504-1823